MKRRLNLISKRFMENVTVYKISVDSIGKYQHIGKECVDIFFCSDIMGNRFKLNFLYKIGNWKLKCQKSSILVRETLFFIVKNDTVKNGVCDAG